MIIRLTQSELRSIIKRVIDEQSMGGMASPQTFANASVEGTKYLMGLDPRSPKGKIAKILDDASKIYTYGLDLRPGGSVVEADIIFDWAKKNPNFDPNLLVMTLILFNKESNFGNFLNKIVRWQNWGELLPWADKSDYSQGPAQIKPSTGKRHNLDWEKYKSGFLGALTETYKLVTQYYNSLKTNYTGDKVTMRGSKGYYFKQGVKNQAINTAILAAHNSNIENVNHRWCKSSSPKFLAGPCTDKVVKDDPKSKIYPDQPLQNYIPNYEGKYGSTYKYLNKGDINKMYNKLYEIIPLLKQ